MTHEAIGTLLFILIAITIFTFIIVMALGFHIEHQTRILKEEMETKISRCEAKITDDALAKYLGISRQFRHIEQLNRRTNDHKD